MKFLALIRWFEGHEEELAKYKWSEEKGDHEAVWEVPDGVKLGESAILFGGPYKIAMFFEAETEEQAFMFLKEAEAYGKVERYLTTPCSWCENTKELQKELVKP